MIKNWKKIKEEKIKVGFRSIIKKTFQLPDDRIDNFDIKLEGKVVCVLALTKDRKIILGEQFRPGPEKILLELPGGAVEDGETPEMAVKREFSEETGYAGDFKFVGESFDCAYSTRIRYHFVALNCYKKDKQNLDKTEFIEVREISLDDFKKLLHSGQLTDSETGYRGLNFLGLLH